jgi:hypothetical protein
MAWPEAKKWLPDATRKPPATAIQLTDLTKKKKTLGSGLDWGGFPDFAAHAGDLPGHAHQHRLCSRKETEISILIGVGEFPFVPFACRSEPQNRVNPLPPFVSAHRIAEGRLTSR